MLVSWTRCSAGENPTTMTCDLVVLDGLRGPGRYVGMTGGVRPSDERWWGEGEIKIYFDCKRPNRRSAAPGPRTTSVRPGVSPSSPLRSREPRW